MSIGRLGPLVVAAWFAVDVGWRLVPYEWQRVNPIVAAGRFPAPTGPFRPNARYVVREPTPGEGALGGNLPPSEYRPPYTFTTDEHGYRRNPAARDGNPEVLVLWGDSFTYGAHLSDEETLPAALTRHTGLDAYNLGRPYTTPLTVRDLDALLQRFESRPRLAVLIHLEHHERESPDGEGTVRAAASADDGMSQLAWRATQLWRSVSSFWDVSPFKNELRHAYRRLTDDRILPNTLRGRVATLRLPDGRPMIFRASELEPVRQERDERKLRETADYLAWWERVLAERGMHTVVLVMPTRYTVYARYLGDEETRAKVAEANAFTRALEAELRRRGMRVVSGLEIFQPLAPRELASGKLSFWREDNHWNPRGVDRVARVLADSLRGPAYAVGLPFGAHAGDLATHR